MNTSTAARILTDEGEVRGQQTDVAQRNAPRVSVVKLHVDRALRVGVGAR